MTTESTSTITTGLRVVAALQGLAIAVLAVLLLGGGDIAPAHASPAPAPPPPVAAATAQAGPLAPTGGPDREGAAAAAIARTVRGGGDAGAVGSQLQAAAPEGRAQPVAAAADAVGPGIVLHGRVVGEGGEAITEGVVWFSRPGESKQLATVSLSPRDSCFAIAGLTPGEVAFRTRVTGYLEKSETIPIPDGTPRLRHDIVLAQAWVLVVKILTPDGKPLNVALQEASRGRSMLHHVQTSAIATAAQPDGDFPLTALREADFGLGRWRSAWEGRIRGGAQQPKDVAGVLELDGKQRVWVSATLRHRVLASVAVEPGQAEVTLTVGVDQVLKDLGTIRGRVVHGKTGEPVAGAAVGFGDLQSSGSAGKTDGEGRFEVGSLRPGLLDVEIRAQRMSASRDLVVVQPGQVLDLGDVPVFEPRTIKGRCAGVVGKAESMQLTYKLLDPPSHPALRRYTNSASVAADGTFTLYLAEGRYRVRASGAGGALTEIDTRTRGDEPLVLQLAKESSLRLDVQTNGAPMELAVFDAAGGEVYRRDLRHGWKFALPFLPGDYRIELKDGQGKVDTRRITLGDAGADLRVP